MLNIYDPDYGVSSHVDVDDHWNELERPPTTCRFFSGATQTERIMTALGSTTDGPPKVDEDTLARYYAYLSANLSLPFTAYYPQPMNAQERTQFRCTVLELLDPTRYSGRRL